jgi:hypothetical protein
MAYQKLQQSRAINVIPSDDINIPSPAAVSATGTNESDGTTIIDSTKDFLSSVKVNDTVYNVTANEISTVIAIVGNDELEVSGGSFTIGDEYKIFSTFDVRTEACVLYVGSSEAEQTLTVLTADNDIVTLTNPAQGFVLPLQVKRVLATGTDVTNIVALW